VEELLGRVANRFELGLATFADQIVARMRDEIDEVGRLDSPELWAAIRRMTVSGRRAQARHLRNGRGEPSRLSEADVAAVHLAVHGGISLGAALHAYRIGHDVSLEAWLEAVDQLSLSEEERSAATRAVIRFALGYDDRLARLLEAEYESERSRILGRAAQARLRLMRDLVEGVSNTASDLDYDLSLEHIGLIAWGDGADAVLQSAAHALDARLLSAPTPAGFRWAWLGSSSFDAKAKDALRRLVPENGTALAAGQPGAGVDGFRRTHRQAGAAHVVATRRPQPLTLYEDVALEALALRDESSAREFVADTLSEINGDDARSVRLRTTLLAYFQREQNAAATAAALGLHEDTVRRQLSDIEARTNTRVNQRRAELETALRLRELLTAGTQ
jgi:DNA-binding PucR family transcriptional regulator